MKASDGGDIVSIHSQPTVFGVCHESREEAKKYFKMQFGAFVSKTDTDTFYFGGGLRGLKALLNLWKMCKESGPWAERIAVDWEIWATLLIDEYDDNLESFVNETFDWCRYLTIAIDPSIRREGEITFADAQDYPILCNRITGVVERKVSDWLAELQEDEADNDLAEFSDEASAHSSFFYPSERPEIDVKFVIRDESPRPHLNVDLMACDPDCYNFRLQMEALRQKTRDFMEPYFDL